MRESIQAAIAAQLATGHGRAWGDIGEDLRWEYLADADALIAQGLTPFWEELSADMKNCPPADTKMPTRGQ